MACTEPVTNRSPVQGIMAFFGNAGALRFPRLLHFDERIYLVDAGAFGDTLEKCQVFE
jgi:hypothetical protein